MRWRTAWGAATKWAQENFAEGQGKVLGAGDMSDEEGTWPGGQQGVPGGRQIWGEGGRGCG